MSNSTEKPYYTNSTGKPYCWELYIYLYIGVTMEQIAIEFESTEGGKIHLEDLERYHFRSIKAIAMEYHLSGIELNEPVSIDGLNSFFQGQEDN